ncbi:hypothetical protein L3X38_032382 [Prunus dulcis]|uniref:Agenet-like domain-containing protein n=1 Tax=Prunus dulcis TaxID=3755 RepID=A0AAD4VE03_PRUDU|nr:hypothetical protein L3X38_032382 [Prunus dulcis]
MVKRRQAHLSKDSKVEVCSNEERYRDPWFSATILDPEPSDPATNNKRNNLGNSSKALAQYDNLWLLLTILTSTSSQPTS